MKRSFAFCIFAATAFLAFSAAGCSSKSDSGGPPDAAASQPTSQSAMAPAPATAEQIAHAKKIIAGDIRVPESDIAIHNVKWFDLVGDGVKTEFYADYRLPDKRMEEKYKGDHYVCLYSTRGEQSQRLFREIRYLGEARAAEMQTFGGKPYLLMTHCAGSGGYFSFRLYHWDGTGTLVKDFDSDNVEECRGGMFQGDLRKVGGRWFAVQSGMRSELVYKDGCFRLVPYRHRPTYPERGKEVHILRLDVDKDDKLTMQLDGKPLRFAAPDAAEHYALKTPISIKLGESILVDDNIGKPSGLRLFGMKNATWNNETLFPILQPETAGEGEMSINHHYGPWYDMPIVVTSPAARKFITPGYIVTITRPNTREGDASCDNCTYHGVSRRTGKAITLKGGTYHPYDPQKFPSQLRGYHFDNGDVTYAIRGDRLLVTQGDRVLIDEKGNWAE